MTDYSELVKFLRGLSPWAFPDASNKRMRDAADAIEALLKENKELIEDRPEMVEADGHWEWRKPNGEVLMPKQGDIVRCAECKWYDPLDRTRPFFCPVMDCVTGVMEDDFCSRGERREKKEVQDRNE